MKNEEQESLPDERNGTATAKDWKVFQKSNTPLLFLQLFYGLFSDLYKAEPCWKGLAVSRTFLLTITGSTIAACPRFSDTKDFREEHSEHLKTSLHFVFSHTLFLSFDLHFHKGSQNAKMFDHSTAVLLLQKLLGSVFVP